MASTSALSMPPPEHSAPPLDDATKSPPHSIEAELAILGGIISNPDTASVVFESVQTDDFYRKDHRLIFDALYTLDNDGMTIDLLTLSDWLDSHKQLDEAGGFHYLDSLRNSASTPNNILAYANIVRNRSMLRKLLVATSKITDHIVAPKGLSSEQLLDYAEQMVFQIAERGNRGKRGFLSISALAATTVEQIKERAALDSAVTGLPTGYKDLDEPTAGLHDAELVVLAARPSMGKTAFALNVAEHIAMKNNKTVALFSLEMPAEQIAMRMMASCARLDQQKVRQGLIDDEDWPRLSKAVSHLAKSKIILDDTGNITPAELRSRSRRIAREHGLDLIIIDYLQLINLPDARENRATEIAQITRSLKALAKDLNVPVLALSQLNRNLEQRGNKRPVMSDLRESGAIEQDADVVLFIYRDEVYNAESPDKGIAEIIIAKQRNGPTGTLKLTFLDYCTRFENYLQETPAQRYFEDDRSH